MALTHVYKKKWGNRYFVQPGEITSSEADDLYCALCGHRVFLTSRSGLPFFEHEPGAYECAEKPAGLPPLVGFSLPTPGQSFVIRPPDRKSRIDNSPVFEKSPSSVASSVVYSNVSQAAPFGFSGAYPVSPAMNDFEDADEELLKTEAFDADCLPEGIEDYLSETQAVSIEENIDSGMALGQPNEYPQFGGVRVSQSPTQELETASRPSKPVWNPAPNPDLQATIMDDEELNDRLTNAALPSADALFGQEVKVSDAVQPRSTLVNQFPIPRPQKMVARRKQLTILLTALTAIMVLIVIGLIAVAIGRSNSPGQTPTIKSSH